MFYLKNTKKRKMRKVYSCKDDFDPTSTTVSNAIRKILSDYSREVKVKIPTEEALSYVLFSDIKSPVNVPNYNNSAMDGYAIHIKSININDEIKVIDKSLAGKASKKLPKENECVKITTGAVMPKNCDAVVMQEEVNIVKSNFIKINTSKIKKNQNVRFLGEDIKKGDLILNAGKKLNAADIGVISSMGIKEVFVYKKPIVSFFTTGDEVRPISKKLKYGELYDSNRYTIKSLLNKHGIKSIDLGHAKDSKYSIKNKFTQGIKKSDIILTSGGVSVGEADYIKDVTSKLGRINFWKVSVKPGRPLTYGKIKNRFFFGLPGNPVSTMITFIIFVLPLIYKMSGDELKLNYIDAITSTALKKRKGRAEFQRGISYIKNGKRFVKGVGSQGSGILSSMSRANCLIYLDDNAKDQKIGSKVKILELESLI